MQKNTCVTLGTYYEKFIAQQVSQGHFSTASETIREGLRLFEEKEIKFDFLRRAHVEGEESGSADYSLSGLIDSLDKQSFV